MTNRRVQPAAQFLGIKPTKISATHGGAGRIGRPCGLVAVRSDYPRYFSLLRRGRIQWNSAMPISRVVISMAPPTSKCLSASCLCAPVHAKNPCQTVDRQTFNSVCFATLSKSRSVLNSVRPCRIHRWAISASTVPACTPTRWQLFLRAAASDLNKHAAESRIVVSATRD